jgi:hypothetical protein
MNEIKEYDMFKWKYYTHKCESTYTSYTKCRFYVCNSNHGDSASLRGYIKKYLISW